MAIEFIFKLNKKTIILDSVSEEIDVLLGFPAADFLKRSELLQNLIHHHDQNVSNAIFSNKINDIPIATNIRVRNKDGKIKCVQAQYRKPTTTDSDDVTLYLSLQDAISMEVDTEESTICANFFAMMDNTDDYIYFKNRHHVFTGASQTLVAVTDPSEHWSDLIGLTDYDVFSEELADQYYSLEKQVFSGEIKVAHEIQPTLDNEGNQGWVDNRKYPITDSNGDIIGLFGIARDITTIKQAEQDLLTSREREHDLGTIIEDSLNEVFILDANTLTFLYANSAALHNVGYSLAELKVLTPLAIGEYLDQEALELILEPLRNNSRREVTIERIHIRKDGTQYPVEVHIQLQSYDSKAAFIAMAWDISERKVIEKQLQISSRLFNEAHEGITITDQHGVIIDVNPTFCEITGYSREEVIGKNPNILSSGKQNQDFYTDMWAQIKDKGYWQGEVWNRKKNGELYAEMLSISALKDETGYTLHYVGMFSDITMSKEHKAKLEQLAHYDALTKLPNRVLLSDRFGQAVAHSKRSETLLAVCFLDLDDFKPVNDTYGHETGDAVLIEVAKRIKAAIREEDTVSRMGGDEFVLLLGDITSVTRCNALLDRIIDSVSHPYLIKTYTISISASIGVSIYPLDNEDLDSLVRHADQAMYNAKLSGKNSYQLFDATESLKITKIQKQLAEIEHALAHEEFCLFYQPKVNMITGKIIGVEALIRWQHPEKGLVPPMDFLPIIDGTALEVKVGDWVVEQSLKQLDEWSKQGIEIEVSINIASYHLQSESFISKLDTALSLYPDVDSKCLQIEVLESSVLSDLDSISRIMTLCRERLGVSFALDDFGTGYSSLSHIKELPAGLIKIDQSFVLDILKDPNDYAIIEGVIGLADAFNRQVIAEGVETVEHGLMLIIMGCEQAQGYVISRPMPARELPQWMKDYTPIPEWLTCAHKELAPKEQKVKLLKLASKYWMLTIEQKLLSTDADTELQLEEEADNHLHLWIKRLRKEHLFKDAWLDRVQQAQQVLHFIGNEALSSSPSDDRGEMNDELAEFHGAFERMNSIIDQYE